MKIACVRYAEIFTVHLRARRIRESALSSESHWRGAASVGIIYTKTIFIILRAGAFTAPTALRICDGTKSKYGKEKNDSGIKDIGQGLGNC